MRCQCEAAWCCAQAGTRWRGASAFQLCSSSCFLQLQTELTWTGSIERVTRSWIILRHHWAPKVGHCSSPLGTTPLRGEGAASACIRGTRAPNHPDGQEQEDPQSGCSLGSIQPPNRTGRTDMTVDAHGAWHSPDCPHVFTMPFTAKVKPRPAFECVIPYVQVHVCPDSRCACTAGSRCEGGVPSFTVAGTKLRRNQAEHANFRFPR